MPEVSIGMPVFNDKRFLSKALDSLLEQTFQDFELIISDDASTDGSESVCLAYAQKDARIKYIRQGKNIGISSNMKFLLKEAKGKFFMWAGNDDEWDKDFIRILVESHIKNPDAIVCFCPMVFIDEDGNIIPEYGVREISYEASFPRKRIKILINVFDDAFGYGLFKREMILGVEFPIWWWINASCAYNNIYPTLCYYLAIGNFRMAGDKPLWFNRLKKSENINHKVPYNKSFIRGWFAFSLRKFNLTVFSLRQIFRANRDIFLPLSLLPLMAYKWFLYPSFLEFRRRFSAFLKRKLKFF